MSALPHAIPGERRTEDIVSEDFEAWELTSSSRAVRSSTKLYLVYP